MAKNQYLNQVARLFQAAAKEEAASFHIVEVVTFMLMTIDHKFGKSDEFDTASVAFTNLYICHLQIRTMCQVRC